MLQNWNFSYLNGAAPRHKRIVQMNIYITYVYCQKCVTEIRVWPDIWRNAYSYWYCIAHVHRSQHGTSASMKWPFCKETLSIGLKNNILWISIFQRIPIPFGVLSSVTLSFDLFSIFFCSLAHTMAMTCMYWATRKPWNAPESHI